MEKEYSTKPAGYYTGIREDYLQELPEDSHASILEIGCGEGDLGAEALRRGLCSEYYGIELFPSAAARAQQQLTEVLVGDTETIELPWETNSFDVLIASEVLEHLRDPWAVLRALRPLLKPGATVLASSPNVANKRVIAMLLRGRWDLTESGIMDRTHLRWFTPRTYAQMFVDCGFVVDAIRPASPLSGKSKMLSALTRGRFDHFLWGQTSIRARVPQESE